MYNEWDEHSSFWLLSLAYRYKDFPEVLVEPSLTVETGHVVLVVKPSTLIITVY